MTISFVNDATSAFDRAVSQHNVQATLLDILGAKIESLQSSISGAPNDREEHLFVGAMSALAALRDAIKSAPARVEAEAKAKTKEGTSDMEGFV